MNKQKGFTIIELIVVIAIIAVLAAIVLVNVTQYIAKGKDSSVKGNMSSMVTIAAAYFDNHTSSYTDLEGDAAYGAGIIAIEDANGTDNDVTHYVATGQVTPEVIAGSAFCISSKLNGAGSWCVDSTGYKGDIADCDAATADCAADPVP